MAPILQPYTYQFGDSGFTLNTDYGGVLPFFDVDSISGLDGAPPRINSADRTMRDGSVVSAGFMGMRTIVINGTLYTSSNDPDSVLDRLRSEYGPKRLGLPTPYGLPQYSPTAVQPFYYQHPGKQLRFVMAQGGGVQYAVDTGRRIGVSANVQISLLAADPYIYDSIPSDFTSSGNTAGPLNQNPFFETGSFPWTAVNNATIVQSSTVSHEGYYTLRINGNGATANPIARSEQTIQVTVGAKYLGTIFFYSPSVWASGVQINIRWYTNVGALISTTSGTSASLAATTWTSFTVSGTAPATAAFASIDASILGTPGSGQFFYVDEAKLLPAGGAAFPFSFAANFGGGISTRPAVAVANAGTHVAYPFMTIFGPAKNPTIVDTVGSQSMPFNITLAATDILLIDCRNKMVILQSGVPIPLPPKATSPTPVADILTGTNFQDPFAPFVAARLKYTVRNARAALNGSVFFNVASGTSDTFFLDATSTTSATKFRVTMYNTYY
jgi:hypothetical protein